MVKKKKKLKTGGNARLLRGRGLTCFFNLHTVSKHILVYLRGGVIFNLLDHLILILFRIWAWTLLSSFLRQPYLGINSLQHGFGDIKRGCSYNIPQIPFSNRFLISRFS